MRNEPAAQQEARLKWFREARFGRFNYRGAAPCPQHPAAQAHLAGSGS